MSLFGNKHTPEQPQEEEAEYYVYPVLEGTDYRVHTSDSPFCDDPTCPCHEDADAIHTLNDAYQNGLASTEDADNIYRGRTL